MYKEEKHFSNVKFKVFHVCDSCDVVSDTVCLSSSSFLLSVNK